MRHRCLAILALLLALPAMPAAGQQAPLEVIELRYRSADEVIPILKPLLAPGGSISGLQDKLIVRTTPANLAELRRVLDVLDRVPLRLLISVRQEASAAESRRDIEVAGQVGTGPDSVQARIDARQSSLSGGNTQTVQVNEGNAAYIRIGTSIPVRSRQTTVGPGGVTRQTDTVEYRDVDTGFYAQPRVSGEQVTIQIAARRDSVSDGRHSALQIQRVESVVSGRLGEWIEVGAIAQEEVRDDSGTIFYRSSAGSDRRRTFLKVERLP
jgi:type II secretory pathway component GspD/PulD (secretin)